jgi:hypothetical protein
MDSNNFQGGRSCATGRHCTKFSTTDSGKKMYEHSCRNSRTLELFELGTHSYTKLTANYEVEGWRSCVN